jgi:hypothetical protein
MTLGKHVAHQKIHREFLICKDASRPGSGKKNVLGPEFSKQSVDFSGINQAFFEQRVLEDIRITLAVKLPAKRQVDERVVARY